MKRLAILKCLAAILALEIAENTSSALAETIWFNNLGTFQTPSLSFPSVVISGSAPVYALNYNGIGIFGGYASDYIDGHEFMAFHFSQPAINISFGINNGGNLDRNGTLGAHFLLGYDASGDFLGSVPHNIIPDGGPVTDVSGFFNNVPLSEFRILADVDGIGIRQLTFTLVPEPSVFALAGLGAAALMIARRRR